MVIESVALPRSARVGVACLEALLATAAEDLRLHVSVDPAYSQRYTCGLFQVSTHAPYTVMLLSHHEPAPGTLATLLVPGTASEPITYFKVVSSQSVRHTPELLRYLAHVSQLIAASTARSTQCGRLAHDPLP